MPSRSTYFIVYISLFYFAPLLIMGFAYAMIVEKLWHRKVESPSRSPNRQISTLHRRTRRKVHSSLRLLLTGGVLPPRGGCFLLMGASSRGGGVLPPGRCFLLVGGGAWWRPPRDGYCCGGYGMHSCFICNGTGTFCSTSFLHLMLLLRPPDPFPHRPQKHL